MFFDENPISKRDVWLTMQRLQFWQQLQQFYGAGEPIFTYSLDELYPIAKIKDLNILDFGSEAGATANYFAKFNDVIAVEPNLPKRTYSDNRYVQLKGDVKALDYVSYGSMDLILLHNVLEYIPNKDKPAVLCELLKRLKPGGYISIVKHIREGRVFEEVTLLEDLDEAIRLLNGGDSYAYKYGPIYYYDESDITRWSPELVLRAKFGACTFARLKCREDNADWAKLFQLECLASKNERMQGNAFFNHLIFQRT